MEKNQWASLELCLLDGVKAGRAANWAKQFGGAANVLEQSQWPEGINERQRGQLEQLRQSWRKQGPSEKARQVWARCEQMDIAFIGIEHALYPEMLRQIADPPVGLFCKGNMAVLRRPCVSIVGTRQAGGYGSKVAYETAVQTAKAGATIVSGLAVGIDACAHKGALDAKGATVAVMPCGLDLCYPKSNRWLYHRIVETGLAISEYPPGRQPEKWFFLDRNRLISGLSLITLVAQAGPKSGAIRTAQLAAEQGREVFGAPGDLFDTEYLGVHNLLQDGANVLTSPQSLLRMLRQEGHLPAEVLPKRKLPSESVAKLGHSVTYGARPRAEALVESGEVERLLAERKRHALEKAGTERWLYEKIEAFGSLPERLCQLTGKSAAQVQQAITILEIKGLIRQDEQRRIIQV